MRGRAPSRRPWLVLCYLAALLAMLALASPAGATFSSGGWSGGWFGSGGWSGDWSGGWFGDWLGISLRELTDGDGKDDSFSSLDGSFSFSGFEAEVSDFALRNLDFYRVFPLEDGFKLLAPMGALCGSQGQLELSYEVTANEQAGQEFLVEAMSMSILGVSIGPGAELQAIADLFDPKNRDVPLLEDPLKVEAHGLFTLGHGGAEESPPLTPPLPQVLIKESVEAASGSQDMGKGGTTTCTGRRCSDWGGLAAGTVVTHRFTAVVPEPATALMLGGGLAGLVVLGRHRRRDRGLRR